MDAVPALLDRFPKPCVQVQCLPGHPSVQSVVVTRVYGRRACTGVARDVAWETEGGECRGHESERINRRGPSRHRPHRLEHGRRRRSSHGVRGRSARARPGGHWIVGRDPHRDGICPGHSSGETLPREQAPPAGISTVGAARGRTTRGTDSRRMRPHARHPSRTPPAPRRAKHTR